MQAPDQAKVQDQVQSVDILESEKKIKSKNQNQNQSQNQNQNESEKVAKPRVKISSEITIYTIAKKRVRRLWSWVSNSH